jgi:RNA polymerase sigma-70 factor (ECF subfamily)
MHVLETSDTHDFNPQPESVPTASKSTRTREERALEALVARMAAGDEHALASLYDSTNRIVYGVALRILGDPSSAEDTAMEVYMQLWRTAGSFDPDRASVKSWLATLARSRALDQLRRRRTRRGHLEDNVDEMLDLRDSRPGPEVSGLNDERVRILHEAMSQLSSDQRQAIELAFFAGLTHVEAAVQLGLPLGTAKSRIRSGMLQLRKFLEPYAEVL